MEPLKRIVNSKNAYPGVYMDMAAPHGKDTHETSMAMASGCIIETSSSDKPAKSWSSSPIT